LLDLNSDPGPNPLPTYRWKALSGLAAEAPSLCSAGEHGIVLVDDLGAVRRLELKQAGSGLLGWSEMGDFAGLSKGRFFAPVASEEFVFLVDHAGMLYAVNLASGEAGGWQCSLPYKPIAPPVVRGESLIVLLESRRVACIDIRGRALRWVSDPAAGRICGQPVLIDDGLLIADESRQLTAMDLGDGRPRWQQTLPVEAGPAAAAVPFGPDRYLVPLDDGTMLVVNRDVKRTLTEAK
jgi:hypothetical protein